MRRRLLRKGEVTIKRAFVIGLDGMDPELADEFMEKGLLPNFSKLKEMGSFMPLKTTCPAISPVAWSSFSTGTNPARHAIYDFFTRDKASYLPILSSVHIGRPKHSVKLGRYNIPLGRTEIRFLRKGVSFWKILGDAGIASSVIRVPITFPPEKFSGRLLSAMCVPDLKGTQGSFTFYTSSEEKARTYTGGTCLHLKQIGDGIFSSFIPGPLNSLLKDPEELQIGFKIRLNGDAKSAEIELQKEKINISHGEFTDWIRLLFDLGLNKKINGIVRFYAMSLNPDSIGLYVTPINIDPEYPVLPISFPYIYSAYLSKLIGPYATLGLAEDTWALNERIIDEDAFLKQCYIHHEERENMLFNELKKIRQGVCCCVFDTTDRIQHMFWRYRDGASHPSLKGMDPDAYSWVIEGLYRRMDEMLGRIMGHVDDNTLLFVISDHGFKSFKRGVNLNTWLHKNGYLALKGDPSEKAEWFTNVDWSKTKAFALGLAGIFINIKGRESKGIVNKGKEAEMLKEELIKLLTGLIDEEKNTIGITTAYNSSTVHHGPYNQEGPDILIGYASGYRASWESATGTVTKMVFCDNTKSWSGDHCIDPKHVPGVIFSNKKIKRDTPCLIDIAPTLLWEFGLNIPSNMEGKTLFEGERIQKK